MWEGVETVRAGLLKHGVTAFCPTVVTSDVEYYHRVLWTSSKPPPREGEGTCFPLSSFTCCNERVCIVIYQLVMVSHFTSEVSL